MRQILVAVTLNLVTLLLATASSSGHAARNVEASRLYEDALLRFEKGDIAGSTVQLRSALQRDPEMLAAHILLAKTQLLSGQALAAVETFEKSLLLGVDRTEIVVSFSEALLAVGRPARLLELFEANAFPPASRPGVLLLRGNALAQQGKLDQAVQSYEHARQLDPRYSPALIALAETSLQQSRPLDAIAFANSAVETDPGNAQAWAIRGTIAHAKPDQSAALADYSKSLELDPNNLEARVGRAALLLDMGRSADAEVDSAYLTRNMPLEPRGSYIRALLAKKRGDQKAWRSALLDTVGALDKMPPEVLKVRAPRLLILAGLSYHALGQYARARAYLENFLRAVPEHAGARKMLASVLLSQGDARAAAHLLEPVLQTGTSDPNVYALLAAANLDMRKYKSASDHLEKALALSGSSASMHAALGFSFLEGGHVDAAMEHLEQAFKKNPGNARVGVALATMLMKQGLAQRATQILEAAARGAPADTVVLNLLGVARGINGDVEGARKAYESAIAIEPAHLSSHINLARLDRIARRFTAARDRLERQRTARPKAPQILFELGLLADAEGKPGDAVIWYQRARDADPLHEPAAVSLMDALLRSGAQARALEVAKSAESAFPEGIETMWAVGRAYLANGDRRNAGIAFERMARLASRNPEALLRAVSWLQRAGNTRAAENTLTELLRKHPAFNPAQVVAAELEMQSGKLKEAESRAMALVDKAPRFGGGHRLLGDLALRQGQAQQAATHYQRALAVEQTTENVVRWARSLALSKQPEKARSVLESWLANKPQDSGAREMLAEAYLSGNDLANARRTYEDLLKRHGDHAHWLNNLANIQFRQGDTGAKSTAERAYKLNPTDPATADTLGWISVQGGHIESGLQYLRDARLRSPGNPEIRYHLAVALAKSGRRQEALAEVDSALSGNVLFDEREEAVKFKNSLR